MGLRLRYQTFAHASETLEYASVSWDSETFGLPITDLRWPDALPGEHALSQWLEERPSPSLAVTKVPAGNIAACQVLARHRFYPVENILLLELPLADFVPVSIAESDRWRIRPMADPDLQEVQEIARVSFRHDRFHLDAHFQQDRADQRIVSWITRAYRGGEAVLVLEDRSEGSIVGFFYYRDEGQGRANAALASVTPSLQSSNLSPLLFEVSIWTCRERGFHTMQTWTPTTNLPSLNLGIALGFHVRESRLTFHHYKASV